MLASLLCCAAIPGEAYGEDVPAERGKGNRLLESGGFIHIPGPNPILVPGKSGAWDEGVIEAADAFKDGDVYYFYYHGTGQGKSYRLGVSTAPGPLGPFRKHGDKPVLDLGPPGSWDDRCVACAMIVKEDDGKYLMWYSGIGGPDKHPDWSIGLAAAPGPLGPWKKHPGNPILKDFGYVGGVVKVKGKYYLYTAHPIGSVAPDYSPMALAVADSPAGPWTRWAENPVLREGEKGEWDDGGFSEAEVLYHDGIFHMFYGGAKIYKPRILSRESVGYAYSTDGYRFVKYGRNPVAPREANPNAAAFAEVHAIIEPPFVYLYHTLRYKEPRTEVHRRRFPNVEDLGIQVLVIETPFQLDMPILTRDTVDTNTTTPLIDSPPVCLGNVKRVALTAQCTYSPKATRPIGIQVRSSSDGIRYDKTDLCRFDNDLKPGGHASKTFKLDTQVPFIKVLVENPDPSESVSEVTITATLGG